MQTDILEVADKEYRPQEGPGMVSCGRDGSTKAAEMADRAGRVANFRQRFDYREIIPCEKCYHCVTIRGFNKRQEEITRGCYCIAGEMPVDKLGTCNNGYRAKNGRVRVIYDLENAPRGFAAGVLAAGKEKKSEMPAKRNSGEDLNRGYLGGSEAYNGSAGLKGLEMPRRLMN